jgi:site-specific DNA recombinase
MKNLPKHAGIYIRVSTINQVDKDSLTTQEERLISYCKGQGIESYTLYRDAGVSAKNTERPALNQLMKAIKNNEITAVFVTKIDRITRSIKDLINLVDFFEKQNVKFISIADNIDTSNAMGRFMQYLLGIIAQLEREMTAERVSTDMHHRAQKGKWNGGIVPYGYATQAFLYNKYKSQDDNLEQAFTKTSKICPEPKKLYIYSEESKYIEWIFNHFLQTNSVRKTAIELNNRGVKTRKGNHWPSSTIHRILRSPIYIGKISYGKRKTSPNGKLVPQDKSTWTVVDGEHEAIIEDEIYNKVQNKLSEIHRKPVKQGRTYLLSGLLRCGKCKGRMSGQTFTKKQSNKSYSYYKCANRLQKGTAACEGLSLPAIAFEDFIIQSLMKQSDNKEFLSDKEKMIEMIKSGIKTKEKESDIVEMKKAISKNQQKLNRLLDKLEDGIITDEDFTPRYNSIKSEINRIEIEVAKIRVSNDSIQSEIKNLEISFEEICSFGKNWEYLDDKGKAMRIQSIVKEIHATEKEVTMETYIDVAKVSHTDKDSWPPPA